ncbi:MAG: RIP metalloprotease RseP [Bacteroidota bacterium]
MEAVFDFLQAAFWIILAITILVFIHELGHFLAAKLFGMKVDKFSVGFPPKIFGKKVGETEYVIGATPLGGYVKIAGMVDESMDVGYAESEPQPWEFRAKPVWQRIVVITAGVIFNVILAAIIFIGIRWIYGETYVPAENVQAVYVADSSVAYNMGLRTGDRIVAVSGRAPERAEDFLGGDPESMVAGTFSLTVRREGRELTFDGPDDIMTQLNRNRTLGLGITPSLISSVSDGSAAYEAGLRPGDRVTALGGEPIQFWLQLVDKVTANGGDTLQVRWERPDSLVAAGAELAPGQLVASRGGVQVYEANLVPREQDGRYVLGVSMPTEAQLVSYFGQRTERFGLGESTVRGVTDTWSNTKLTALSLWRIASGKDNVRENLGGPVMVAQVTSQAAQAGGLYFWRIVALLSITLAIVNILPIPALDGGHLMFLIYEGIARREPSLKVRMAMQQVGMVVLLLLMVFLIFNDILRLT